MSIIYDHEALTTNLSFSYSCIDQAISEDLVFIKFSSWSIP